MSRPFVKTTRSAYPYPGTEPMLELLLRASMRIPGILQMALTASLQCILISIAVGLGGWVSSGQQPQSGQIAGPREIRPDDYVSAEVLRYIQEGQRLASREQYDDAIKSYQLALEKAGKPLFSVFLGLGAAYFGKSDFKAAIDVYKRAISLRPVDPRPHFNLGEVLYSSGDFRTAGLEYRKTLELAPSQPNAPQAHQFVALCLYNQKRLDEAIAEYKIAIQMRKGNYSEAHYNLGIVYMEQGNSESAESEFRTAIQQDKGLVPQDHYNLAVVLEKEKRFVDAADEYERYLQVSPTAEDAAALRLRIANLRKQK